NASCSPASTIWPTKRRPPSCCNLNRRCGVGRRSHSSARTNVLFNVSFQEHAMSRLATRRAARGSAIGNLLTFILLVGLIGLGVYLLVGRDSSEGESASTTQSSRPEPGDGDAPSPIEPVDGTPTLEAAAAYTPKDGVLQIDISEYAGYGGLIVANGGL